MVDAEVRALPVGSLMAVDERGVGLRTTWRLEHGFVNVSLWRDDRCVETFHLTPAAAARLVSFLVGGLAEVATIGPAAPVTVLRRPVPAPFGRVRGQAAAAEDRLRRRASHLLQRAVDRLRR
jgi:hypothetical protein